MRRLIGAMLVCLLLAGSALAELHVVPRVDFGTVYLRSIATEWLDITHDPSDRGLHVTGVVTGNGFGTLFPIDFIIGNEDSMANVVGLVFMPETVGHFTGQLQLFTTDPAIPAATVELVGEGVTWQPPDTVGGLEVWPPFLDFGQVPMATEVTRTVMLRNTSDHIIEVTGELDSDYFTILFPIHAELQPGDSGLVIPVTFRPPSIGHYTGQLEFTTNDPNLPGVNVGMSGYGITPPEIPPQVILLAPENGVWLPGVPITFEWEPLEVDGQPQVSYTLWIAALDSITNPMVATFEAGAATSYTLTDAAYGEGAYVWWMTARWAGDSTMSLEIRNFYIGTPPPDQHFHLLSPEDEATVTLPTVTFTWNQAPRINPALLCTYTLIIFPGDSTEYPAVITVPTTDISATVDITDLAGQEHCHWYVLAHFSDGNMLYSSEQFTFTLGLNPYPAAVDEIAAPVAGKFGIADVAPNPFNPETQITLSVPQAGRVTAIVYDVLGRQVATLVDGPLAAGSQTLAWRPAGPAGLYFLRVQHANGGMDVRRLMFLK